MIFSIKECLVNIVMNHDRLNVWFQKISIPSPWMVTGNSKGVGGLKAKLFKGKYEAKL